MNKDKYELLSELIIKSMANNKENNTELNEMLFDNLCCDDLITKISSKEYFSQISNLLDEAYLLRDEETLLRKINNYSKKKLKRRRLRRIIALSSSVAAIIFVVILITFNNNPMNDISYINEQKNEKVKINNLVLPTLITDDTDVITLNNNEKKIVAQSYAKTELIKEVKTYYHRLIVPFGNTYSVLLEDSSEVVLNSNSELIFPSKFSEKERKVILKGEAFFNIKKESKPFIVETQNSYIKVYGTSFNVNVRDEDLVKTVLVEGSVAFCTKNIKEQFIKPNQLVIINVKSNKHQIIDINIDDYIAWKNGYFKFINTNFSDMITEITNWYGIKIEYEGKEFNNMKVNFSILRSNSIDKTMQFLREVLKINIKKEGGEYKIYK